MGEFNLHPANENVNVKTIPISLNMELCVVCQQKVENGFAVERGAVQPVWGKKEKKHKKQSQLIHWLFCMMAMEM